MKLNILIFFAVFTKFVFAHDLSESIKMLRSNSTVKNLMVVKIKDEIRIEQHNVFTADGSLFLNNRLTRFTSDESQEIEPMFNTSIARMRSSSGVNFGSFFYITFEDDLTIEEGIEKLEQVMSLDGVEYAFFEPKYENAYIDLEKNSNNSVRTENLLKVSYEDKQFYLNPAPEGVDAYFAWTIPGGTGEDIKVIDIETGWGITI